MARGMVCPRPTARRGRSRRRSGGRSGGRCLKPGPVGRNPYLNFLRQFRKQNCGLSPRETIRAGAKEWQRLSKEEKLRFIEEAFYAPKRRRQSSMCGPTRSRRSSRRSRSRRAARSRRPKIGAIQSYFEKPNKSACEHTIGPTAPTHITMSQCKPVRRTTRMATRGRRAKCPTACPTSCPTANEAPSTTAAPAARCMRPGPIQRNPFLNFLREYRKKCCGLTAVETVRQGAKAWKALPKEEKQRFIVEAFYAPKRRRRLSSMCSPVGRRRGRVTKRSRSAMSRRNRAGKPSNRRKAKVC